MKIVRKARGPRLRAEVERLEARLCLASVGWDGPGQGRAELTYYIGDGPSYLDQSNVNAALETALNAWAAVVDIQFTEISRPNLRNSIDLEFGNIDGAGATLAQAHAPVDVNRRRTAGDVLFDTSEQWEIGNSQGSAAFDLVLVAVHEIGHALGLEHSDARNSVMTENVSPRQTFRGLDDSDVESALALYASAIVETGIRGDFNRNGSVDSQDIDLLFGELRSVNADAEFDLTGDGSVDVSDRDVLILEVLGTTYGDANLDGAFDAADIVAILQAAKYQTASTDATWEQGDWDGDGVFGTHDLVLALQSGAYPGNGALV